jgi:hypothetical protein
MTTPQVVSAFIIQIVNGLRPDGCIAGRFVGRFQARGSRNSFHPINVIKTDST